MKVIWEKKNLEEGIYRFCQNSKPSTKIVAVIVLKITYSFVVFYIVEQQKC